MVNQEKLIRQLGQLFLKGGEASISERYAQSWAAANQIRIANPTADLAELCLIAQQRFITKVATSGAASGAVAAAPFLGTLSALGSTAGDLYYFGKSSVNHVLLIAALHDLDLSEPQLRRLTVLSSIAAEPTNHPLDLNQTSFIENLNRKLAERVVIKVGTKLLPIRAAAALPMFIGAAAAASLNAKLAKQVSANAISVIKLQAI